MRIDAHQHFWKMGRFDDSWKREPLQRDFLPEDLAPELRAVGIDRTVAVQTAHDVAETRWMLELADRHDFIGGVVGWVDLASPRCEEQLWELESQHDKLVGIRHGTQDEPDVDFILRDDVGRGLAVLERQGVPFDLLFHVVHLPHAAVLANRHPGLRLVIDHLAKPRIRDGRRDDWLPHLRAAARHPNVYCKLSGLVTEADWGRWAVEDLRSYVNDAVEAFGPARCMFGSDWPVCRLAATYEQVHAVLSEVLGACSPAETAQIFGGTAAEFYGLSV